VSTIRAGHDVRCERSATKASRCRCECGGNLDGVEASQIDLRRAYDRHLITDDELADALSHLRAKVEVYR
jgi:hypothetical protein